MIRPAAGCKLEQPLGWWHRLAVARGHRNPNRVFHPLGELWAQPTSQQRQHLDAMRACGIGSISLLHATAAKRHAKAQHVVNVATGHSAHVKAQTLAASRQRLVHWLCVPLLAYASFSTTVSAAELPAPPQTGSCTDCIGEFNSTLNDCTLSSLSCVSTQNDDELHFMAPWQYDQSTSAAIESLVAVATGGRFEPALLQQPFGISRTDALGFIAKGFQAAVTGNRPPERPKFQQEMATQAFDGVLADRHRTADGSAEYVHIVFGAQQMQNEKIDSKAVNVIDAEFLFLTDDNIVDIRASSRGIPGQSDGQVSLSLSKGLVYDQNIAQRQLERLRKAMQWESAPVITGFDPRYNQNQSLFFEKLYQPFLPKSQRTTFGDDRP